MFGELEFKELDDFVIVRKNGWPTFHLANVIDDWLMEITHVMRGEEWLTNTNKHIYLYLLLGAPLPKFVHLPLIRAMDGRKLAKRDPTSSVKLIQESYEVDAVRSMLATLGLLQEKLDRRGEAANEKGKGEEREKGR